MLEPTASLRLVGPVAAVLVVCSLACGGPPERVPRSEAYTHVFEVVVLVPDAGGGERSVEIMRLRQAEDAAAADPGVTFLPAVSAIESVVRTIAAGSEGDYTQSLGVTQVADDVWELTLSTGGNTTRDISTYRTDGRTIEPVAYERHAVMSSGRRYVYADDSESP